MGVSVWWFMLPLVIAGVLSVVARKFLFETILQTPPPIGASVLITGCSSGFGKGFAQRLAQHGLVVYAGVRKMEDGDKIRDALNGDAKTRLIPVILDVSRPDQIDSARDFIANRVDGLFAVVNNAGIQAVSPVETISVDEFRRVFEVNVFGAMAVTKAFAPLLRSYSSTGKRSHLVFISSVAGVFVPPFMASYAATKHAVEALCDGLRVEMRPFNTHVSLMEPGSFESEILKQFPSLDQSTGPEEKQAVVTELYEAKFNRFLRLFHQSFKSIPKPQPVFMQLESILFAKFPPSRALVGVDATAVGVLALLVPDTIIGLVFRAVDTVAGFMGSSNKKQ